MHYRKNCEISQQERHLQGERRGIATLEPRETSDRRGKFPNVRLAQRKLHARIRVHATARAARTSGQVAQLVEQRTENPRAEGSSPPLTTM